MTTILLSSSSRAQNCAVLVGYTDAVAPAVLEHTAGAVHNVHRLQTSALLDAAAQGQTTAVQTLLEAGVSPNVPSPSGQNPLHLAARSGHDSVVALLVKAGASVDALDPSGCTALHAAAVEGHTAVASELIAAGASVTIKSTAGLTAIHFAAHKGSVAVLQLLLSAGADADAASQEGITPLLCDVQGTHLAAVQQLIAAGVDVNAAGPVGERALHFAAASGHVGIVQQLLQALADVDAVNFEGVTALQLAAQEGHSAVVGGLLEAGAAVDIANLSGAGALHLAAVRGHETVVQQLMAAGASPTAVTAAGVTALQLAVQHGHDGVIQLMLEQDGGRALVDKLWTAQSLPGWRAHAADSAGARLAASLAESGALAGWALVAKAMAAAGPATAGALLEGSSTVAQVQVQQHQQWRQPGHQPLESGCKAVLGAPCKHITAAGNHQLLGTGTACLEVPKQQQQQQQQQSPPVHDDPFQEEQLPREQQQQLPRRASDHASPHKPLSAALPGKVNFPLKPLLVKPLSVDPLTLGHDALHHLTSPDFTNSHHKLAAALQAAADSAPYRHKPAASGASPAAAADVTGMCCTSQSHCEGFYPTTGTEAAAAAAARAEGEAEGVSGEVQLLYGWEPLCDSPDAHSTAMAAGHNSGPASQPAEIELKFIKAGAFGLQSQALHRSAALTAALTAAAAAQLSPFAAVAQLPLPDTEPSSTGGARVDGQHLQLNRAMMARTGAYDTNWTGRADVLPASRPARQRWVRDTPLSVPESHTGSGTQRLRSGSGVLGAAGDALRELQEKAAASAPRGEWVVVLCFGALLALLYHSQMY